VLAGGGRESVDSSAERCVVLVSDAYAREHMAELSHAFPHVKFIQASRDGELPEGIEATRAVLRYQTSNEEMRRYLRAADDVEWIQSFSAGFDHWVLPEMLERNIAITRSAATHNIPIAEMVIAFIMQMAKRLPELARAQAAHKWASPGNLDELTGKMVGIIGAGAIGREIAWRCAALGMRVIGVRRTAASLPNFEQILPVEETSELLAVSDYVVLAAPMTEATRGLIGRDQLEMMKSTACLINIARGSLVVLPDLVTALSTGRIAGACLDAHAPEPLPADSPLWDLPTVVITPHCSGFSAQNESRSVAEFKENLRRFLSGEELENRFVPSRGY